MPAAPPSRRLLPRAERRAAILRAAAAAFAQRGFAATSMEDVAAVAGVTKLILYRHFDSKEALYEAVLGRVSARLTEEFVANFERLATGEVAVRALLTVAREEPDGFVLLWRHAARERQFAEHAARFRARAVDLAAATLARQGVGEPVRRRWEAELLVSFLVDATVHWLEQGSPERDEEAVALVVRGVTRLVRTWSQAESGDVAPAPAARSSR